MQGPRFAMLVHLAMTLSAVNGWGMRSVQYENKTSSLSSNESAITGGADGAQHDRRQLDPSSCNAGCNDSCDGYFLWYYGPKYGCDDSCDSCDSCDESCGDNGWFGGGECDDGCDSCVCDASCDTGCDSSCDVTCDHSCDDSCRCNPLGCVCDHGCDASCDRPC
mmetsp:Transcript_19235/g.48348  ORF Transcript_19235/g.48348 Transcript_19235/m.48348 type:complete len:164 (+) Transcript_19235:318-809(+)